MSRFVSARTNEEPPERDDEWLKAQQEVDQNRKRKEEESRQQDGKSLFEVLQANKAAKQEAFEESIRLKNQFRSLDDDEVDFLDSVLESTRAKEAAIRKETTEQLELFKRQQEDAEKLARSEQEQDIVPPEEELWHTGIRKRKKGREKESLVGVKLRRISSTAAEKATANSLDATEVPVPVLLKLSPTGSLQAERPTSASGSQKEVPGVSSVAREASGVKDSSSSTASPPIGLGLGAYSSDEE